MACRHHVGTTRHASTTPAAAPAISDTIMPPTTRTVKSATTYRSRGRREAHTSNRVQPSISDAPHRMANR